MARSPVVLFVCTGNVCRSPAAALLLRARLGTGAGVTVGSAGVSALLDAPIDPATAYCLRSRGLEPSGARSRQLLPGMVEEATVLLTMTVEQRAAVVGLVPSAVRRTFTLLEFAALAVLVADDLPAVEPADRLTALVRAVPRARAVRPPGDDDIEDPYGRGGEVAERVVTRIGEAVDAIVTALTGARTRTVTATGAPIGVLAGTTPPGDDSACAPLMDWWSSNRNIRGTA